MIYKLKKDYENACSILIDNIELATKMPAFRPRFFASTTKQDWVAPDATFYYSENFKGAVEDTPDITIWATGVLALNPKAFGLFRDSLENSGEFLPISINNETHYLLNTLYIIPEHAINKENAVEVIDSGVHFGQCNVVFDESFLDSEQVMVFKSNTDRLLHSFCTDKFKKMYEANRFKGLVFEAVETRQ